MDLAPFVDTLRSSLAAAGEAGGDSVREAAERLSYALDPSARLVLMEALSEAAAEITADLPDAASVEVRLDGRDVAFVVEVSAVPSPPAPPTAPTPPPPPDVDDGGLARVSLRLPESLKAQAEERAAAAGQSLNTWLVGAVRRAADDAVARPDLDVSSIPSGGDPFGTRRESARRMTGWL